MKCAYKPNHQLYQDYYLNQVGRGLPVYRGFGGQRGGGFGSVLGGLLRSTVPLLKAGGKHLLKQVAQTGLNVLGDVGNGENIKTSLKRRAKEGGASLVKRAIGNPTKIKRKSIKKKAHKQVGRAARKVHDDIFN